jgi:hypothetical protein
MGLREADVELLIPYYPGLRVLARRAGPAPVVAVEVPITGIVGGLNTAKCRYLLVLDTTDVVAAIPPVWVRSPADAGIKHVNIWHARENFCPWTGTNLPSFCWYQYGTGWSSATTAFRTLGAALEYAKQFLNTENHDSRAR